MLRTITVPLLGLSSILAWNTGRPSCFCTPQDACWPTTGDLEALSTRLSPGALISPHPTAYPCHDPNFNQTGCTLANNSVTVAPGQNYVSDPIYLASLPGSMQNIASESNIYGNDTTLACAIDSPRSDACRQGSVPTFGIKVAREEDFVEGLNFARDHNLRVVVKSTGWAEHDFLGRSTAPDSLLIWTHEFNNVTILPSFTPTGCSKATEHVMRLQAGVYWDQAGTVAAENGRLVVSGISAKGSVGAAGGWQLGAGHSCLSPSYGLGVDNVLQYRVALPPCDEQSSARIVDANESENADLFWALRGGGGPTFGIVTEVYYKTHPEVPTLVQTFSATLVNDGDSYVDLIEAVLNGLPTLTDNHWGGYDFVLNTTVNGTSIYSVNVAYFRPGVTNSTDWDSVQNQNDTIQEWIGSLSSIASQSPVANMTALSIYSPSWSIVYKMLTDPEASSQLGGSGSPTMETRELGHVDEAQRRHRLVRQMADEKRQDVATPPDGQADPGSGPGVTVSGDAEQTSRLIPRELYSGDKARRYAKWLAKQAVVPANLVAGGAVSEVDPEAMGLNPAWRNALHSIVAFQPPDAVDAGYDALLDIIGGDGGGVYINEVGWNEPNWPYSFWGNHYAKLQELKENFDPLYLLMATWGVSSEKFDSEVRCRKQ